jgi:acetophenone carboxylase
VTADAAREKVSRLNDGVFRQPRFMDTVGDEPGLTKIGITLTKKDDKIKINFDDTSPMLPDKPLNTFFQGMIGLGMVYFCGWFLHDLPANNGLLEILDWEIPENALINAQGDAPTSMAPFPQVSFAHGMFLAGGRMTYHLDPLRAVAAWFQGFGVPIYGGVNQWGEPMADITPEINATGAGARPDLDGVNGAGSWFATMSDCSDVEITESDRPFLYTYRNYFQNSFGHGKYRGGLGVGYGLIPHHVPWVALGSFGYGSKIPSTLGIFGGYAVPPQFIQAVRGSNIKTLLSESSDQLPVDMDQMYEGRNPEQGQLELHHLSLPIQPFLNGDTFYVPVGGGAGYGDPLEREPEAVIADLRDKRTSHWAARNIYRIAYDPDTLRLDPEKTKALRDEARAGRLEKSRPFAEFEAEWLEKRPPDEVLKYYGAYPHPSQGPPPGPPGL